MTETEQEEQFIDADEYTSTPDAAITYELIVLNQIKKCIEEGSKEMTGGYYKEKATSKGTIDIYIGDQKEIYINAINCLYDLLLFHIDDKFKEDDKLFNERLQNIQDKVNEQLQNRINHTENEHLQRELREQMMTGYLNPDLYEARWSSDEKLKTYRFLLQSLIKLYSRKRYLMAQDIDDERDSD